MNVIKRDIYPINPNQNLLLFTLKHESNFRIEYVVEKILSLKNCKTLLSMKYVKGLFRFLTASIASGLRSGFFLLGISSILSFYIMSFCIVSFPIVSFPTMSFPVVSFTFVPCHFLSFHVSLSWQFLNTVIFYCNHQNRF